MKIAEALIGKDRGCILLMYANKKGKKFKKKRKTRVSLYADNKKKVH
jgi:hypothetical protein